MPRSRRRTQPHARDGRFELEAALQTRREGLDQYFPQVSASGGVFQAQHGLVQADFGMTIPSWGR